MDKFTHPQDVTNICQAPKGQKKMKTEISLWIKVSAKIHTYLK